MLYWTEITFIISHVFLANEEKVVPVTIKILLIVKFSKLTINKQLILVK